MEESQKTELPQQPKRTGRGPRRGRGFRLKHATPRTEAKKRLPDPYDPATLERQVQCFEFRCAGMTMTAIAAVLKIDRKTVLADVRMETLRRVKERPDNYEHRLALQLGSYHRISSKIEVTINKLEAEIAQSKDWKERAALRQVIAAERKTLLATQRCVAQIEGLQTPHKIEIEHTTSAAHAVLALIGNISPEQRAKLMDDKRAVYEQRALKNVTPGKESISI